MSSRDRVAVAALRFERRSVRIDVRLRHRRKHRMSRLGIGCGNRIDRHDLQRFAGGIVRARERLRRERTHEVDDTVPPGEGVFLDCSFWLVDVYLLQGRTEEARRLFERLLSLRNDVGLLSEEYAPRDKRRCERRLLYQRRERGLRQR